MKLIIGGNILKRIKLKKLIGKYPEDLVVRFDNYLAIVQNSFKDRLYIHQVSKDMKVHNSEINQLAELLEDSCDLGILIRRYIIRCPECNLALALVDKGKEDGKMKEIKYCYCCELGSDDLDLELNRNSLELLYGIKD